MSIMSRLAPASIVVPGILLGSLLGAGCGVTSSGQKPASQVPPPAPGGPPPTVAQPGTVQPGTPPATGEGQTVVKARRHRFDMDSPANDDFSAELPEVHIYIRPYEDYLSMKVQGREGNRVRVLWLDSEFVDIMGRRYTLVPPGTTLQDAAYGNIPPLDVATGQTWSGKVLLLDQAQARSLRNLNTVLFPIVPADAGTPEQIKGKEFSLRLATEINYERRDYDFLFSVVDVYYQ
jgi:hypothetical protein